MNEIKNYKTISWNFIINCLKNRENTLFNSQKRPKLIQEVDHVNWPITLEKVSKVINIYHWEKTFEPESFRVEFQLLKNRHNLNIKLLDNH